MASVIQICNSALNQLGAGSITALTENSKNARFLTQFEKDRIKYEEIKENLSDINKRTTNIEDNIYILNENNSYNYLKFKALYFIRFAFMIIALLLFMSIGKNVYKMIN